MFWLDWLLGLLNCFLVLLYGVGLGLICDCVFIDFGFACGFSWLLLLCGLVVWTLCLCCGLLGIADLVVFVCLRVDLLCC